MKNNLTGWKSIFQFTLVQNLKSKSIKVTTLIMCLIAMAVLPVVTLMDGEDEKTKDSTSITKVYVVDNSGWNLTEDFSVLKADTYYESGEAGLYTDLEYMDRTEDIISKAAEYVMNGQEPEFEKIYTFDKEDSGVYLEINHIDGNINVSLMYSKDTKVSKSDVEAYNAFIQKHFEEVLLSNRKVSKEALDIIHSCQEVEFYDELNQDGVPEQEDKEENKRDAYWLVYGIAMVILFMLAFGGERIAMSIIVEKSSKIMEYLMTSVKPMAVVVGKVLASLLLLVIQFSAIFASLGISVVIAGFMNSEGSFRMPSAVSGMFTSGSLSTVTPVNLILAILILFAGFLLYGMLAALAGAAVSKMEEISEGVKIYSFIMIIGAYLAIFVISSGNYTGDSFVKYLACFLPVSAPFITPGTLISAHLPVAYGLLVLGILLISLILLTKFVAGVYESMIYYNGSALKIKDIIRISKQNRQQAATDNSTEGKEEK